MAELHIDRDLQAGIELLEKGEKIDKALKLINKSARKGMIFSSLMMRIQKRSYPILKDSLLLRRSLKKKERCSIIFLPSLFR